MLHVDGIISKIYLIRRIILGRCINVLNHALDVTHSLLQRVDRLIRSNGLSRLLFGVLGTEHDPVHDGNSGRLVSVCAGPRW